MKSQSRRSSSSSTEKSQSERKLSTSRRSSPSPVSSKSVFCEAQRRKIQNEKEYEIGRLKQVRMRELRVKQEEERLKSTFEEKELKAEEDKLKQLKRERLKREKILYEREKKVLEMKEKQLWGETRTVPFELDRPWTHRTVARDASICRVITKYPANEEKTLARRSACTSSSRDKRDESVGSSCSLHTSSSRSVFEGNRLGEKMSAKTRLGIRRRSSSRSAKKRLGIRKRSRSSSRY